MKARSNLSKLVSVLLVVLIIAAFLFPVYWTLTTAIKAKSDLFAYPPNLIPQKLTAGNFAAVFGMGGDSRVISGAGMTKYMLNSAIVTSVSCLIAMVIGTLGSYGLVRVSMDKKAKRNLSFYILSTRMLPPIASAIPLYLLFQPMGLINTYAGIVIAHIALNLAFVVWMMQGFFKDIPLEVHEASVIDGCGPFSGFLRVIIPLSAPGLVVTTIFIIIFSWNEFTLGLTLTSESTKTMPVAIASMWTSVASSWGEMAAAAIVATLPVLILALIIQKDLVRGLTFGAIK